MEQIRFHETVVLEMSLSCLRLMNIILINCSYSSDVQAAIV